jgi:hypothetical protein
MTTGANIVADLIILDGSFDADGHGQRVDIVLADQPMDTPPTTKYIQPQCFGYLLALARALNNKNDGWVHKSNFPTVEKARHEMTIYRLKKQSDLKISNNRRGSYKLVANSVLLNCEDV